MMRVLSITTARAMLFVAFGMLCACGSPGATPSQTTISDRRGDNLYRPWLLPNFRRPVREMRVRGAVDPTKYRWPSDLAVSGFSQVNVEIFDGQDKKLRRSLISNSYAYGSTYDATGNLYVATAWPSIEEFSRRGKLKFTYTSTQLQEPVAVTVDKDGNVYDIDLNDPPAGGHIFEFRKESNHLVAECDTGMENEGVAVDNSTKTVFVAGVPNSGSSLLEYDNGLKGCHAKQLTASIGFAGEMLIDKAKNLVVADQWGPWVDIIPPPYDGTNVSRVDAQADPIGLAFNGDESLLYVQDYVASDILVFAYPSGKLLRVLVNGPHNPDGVATWGRKS